jgi:hypothetical protein
MTRTTPGMVRPKFVALQVKMADDAVEPYPTTYIAVPWSEAAYNPYQYRAWVDAMS